MSKFIIQVNGASYSSSASYNAYKFTQSALKMGHVINKVFFYQDGVYNSNALNSPASDEFDLTAAWVSLAVENNIELVNCASAALRRGVLSETEAQEAELSHWNLQAPFTMGGLGELVTGIENSDRLVSF
ncbi:sulfurtransferase complex subunit TusD [Shewanella sp. UCD-KL12]|uniref:sulfurtransferase complex subunit TusD n=1 Tax=Shewanella sp. UCD-KL12 TaxID=1917163 RepID=UPI0009710070|nr:sulfurtransferase complex subunit TusD [Shewanella sp. UCD-KL12]